MSDIWDFGGEGSAGENENSWWSDFSSGAGGWLSDIGKSALSDFTLAGKARIQTEIKNSLSGSNSFASSQRDAGRLNIATDHSDRSGFIPSAFIPTSVALPQRPGTVGGSFSISKITPFLLMGFAGIAGLLVLKRFL